MSSAFVKTNRSGPVLEITLDRPPVNAINQDVSLALHEALRMLQEDADLRVGILTGGGNRIFSAGWDLKELAQASSSSEASQAANTTPGGFAGIAEFWGLKKPVIAALNGLAVGGGFEVVIACDVLIAAEHVEFFLPEMQRGFLPDAGAVQRLPRLIPYPVALEMMLTGRRMSALEAKHWGLVHRVVPAECVLQTAREIAKNIAEGAPLALQALKEVLGSMMHVSLPEAFEMTRRSVNAPNPGKGELPVYEKMLASDDFLEGARAFAEKRKPQWRGY